MTMDTTTPKLDALISLKIEGSKKEKFTRIAQSRGKTVSGWLKEFIDSVLADGLESGEVVPEITRLKSDVEVLREEVAFLRSEMAEKLAA